MIYIYIYIYFYVCVCVCGWATVFHLSMFKWIIKTHFVNIILKKTTVFEMHLILLCFSFKYSIFFDNILFPLRAFCFLVSSTSQFYPTLRLRHFVMLSSSSSSCRVISTDISDPFSPPFSIVHCFRQVFRATSRIGTELLYVGSSWSSFLCSSMWRGPQEYVTYEFVLTSQ